MKRNVSVHQNLSSHFLHAKSVHLQDHELGKVWFLRQMALLEVFQIIPKNSLLRPIYGYLSAQPSVATGRGKMYKLSWTGFFFQVCYAWAVWPCLVKPLGYLWHGFLTRKMLWLDTGGHFPPLEQLWLVNYPVHLHTVASLMVTPELFPWIIMAHRGWPPCAHQHDNKQLVNMAHTLGHLINYETIQPIPSSAGLHDTRRSLYRLCCP